MAEYIVAWLENTIPLGEDGIIIKRRNYVIYNTENSIDNREEATKTYNSLLSNNKVLSVSLSKIIESKAFPERLKIKI